MSPKDTDEKRVTYSKYDNIEIMIGKEIFESLLFRFQTGLEESMERSDFVFDFANLL